MYKFYSRPRKHRTSYLPLAISSAIAFSTISFFFPSKSQHSGYRMFHEGLHVRLAQNSPAYAALEEISEVPSSVNIPTNVQAVTLDAGVGSIEPLVIAKRQERLRDEAAVALALQKKQQEQMRLIVEARAQAERTKLAARIQMPHIPNRGPGTVIIEPAAQVQKPLVHENRAQEKVVHPTKTIRLADLQMHKEELLQQLFGPLVAAYEKQRSAQVAQLAANEEPQRVLITGPARDKKKSEPSWVPVKDTGRSVASPPSRKSEPENLFEGFKQKTAALANPSGSQPGFEPSHTAATGNAQMQLVISGHFEFSGGAAITSPTDQILIYRELEDQPVEAAQVWTRDGRYEIFVDHAQGQLVAELRTAGGDILGKGTFDLDTLPAIRANQYRVDEINLQIKPVLTGLSGRVLSAYSYDSRNFPVPGSRIKIGSTSFEAVSLKDGSFSESNVADGSTVVVRTQREGHWSSIGFAAAGTSSDIMMFPDKMMQAFVGLSGHVNAPNGPNQETAIVWGRVTNDGKPVAGATVEFMTSEEALYPVYFNAMMIPDPTLRETSANGLYAFFPVETGTHAVQAKYGVHKSEPIVFPAEHKFVSNVEVEISTNKKAEIRVFDAFSTSLSLPAYVSYIDHSSAFEIGPSGRAVYNYSNGTGLLFLDVDSGSSYEVTRLALTRDRRYIYAPMLKTSWLDAIRGQVRLNKELHTGTVVGFIQGLQPFRVQLDSSSTSSETKVLYFDSRGQIVDQPYGMPGGGFIVFNIQDGIQTISVASGQSPKALGLTVLVDANVVSVVNHWFR